MDIHLATVMLTERNVFTLPCMLVLWFQSAMNSGKKKMKTLDVHSYTTRWWDFVCRFFFLLLLLMCCCFSFFKTSFYLFSFDELVTVRIIFVKKSRKRVFLRLKTCTARIHGKNSQINYTLAVCCLAEKTFSFNP